MGTMSPAELARATGVTNAAVTGWLNGATKSLKAATAAKIEAVTGYRAMWIVEGRGPERFAGAEIGLDGNPEYPAIKRVRFKLSAGASGFEVDYLANGDGAPIVFRKDWYSTRGFSPDELFAVRVSGQSMEPGLYDQDTVVVNTADKTPQDGLVFAVNYEGELVIKRLIRDEGSWWLASDNHDQLRYPKKRCHDGVFVIGKVVHKQSERI